MYVTAPSAAARAQVTEAQIQAFVRASTIELAVRGIPNLHRIWAVHPELAQAYGITATIPEAVLAHVVPRQQTGPAPGPRQMVPGPWPVPGPASSGERTAGAPSSSGRGASAGRSAGAPSPNLGASSHGAAAPVRGAASVGARAELLVHEDAGHPRDVRPASELQELLSRYPEGHVKHGIVQVRLGYVVGLGGAEAEGWVARLTACVPGLHTTRGLTDCAIDVNWTVK